MKTWKQRILAVALLLTPMVALAANAAASGCNCPCVPDRWALGMVASRYQGRGLQFLIGAASIAAATGAFGCSVAGAWGIMGMLAGGLLGLLPIQIRDQLR